MQQHNSNHRFVIKMVIAAIVLMCAMAVSCCLGSANITLKEVALFFLGKKDELSNTDWIIMEKIRVPRVFMGALVGGALAVVGSIMQGVFRNPMADPSVLGISSGSALGAAISIILGIDGSILGGAFTGTYIGAMAGGAITWLIVYTIAQRSGEYDTNSTLLAGIAISSILTAGLNVLLTMDHEKMERIYLWMLGSLSSSSRNEVIAMAITDAVCVLLIIVYAPRIDILKLGKETSKTLGVSSSRTMGLMLFLSSLLLAVAVAACGIIGFVGLIIPHVVEFFGVRKMRQKVSLSFLVGAIFLVVCDAVAKTIISPSEMAIGAITGLIGAPYFLWLLLSNSKVRRTSK